MQTFRRFDLAVAMQSIVCLTEWVWRWFAPGQNRNARQTLVVKPGGMAVTGGPISSKESIHASISRLQIDGGLRQRARPTYVLDLLFDPGCRTEDVHQGCADNVVVPCKCTPHHGTTDIVTDVRGPIGHNDELLFVYQTSVPLSAPGKRASSAHHGCACVRSYQLHGPFAEMPAVSFFRGDHEATKLRKYAKTFTQGSFCALHVAIPGFLPATYLTGPDDMV